MTLTQALARDPPRARRFRLLAPLLVLLSLALLAMAPGLLVHFSADEQEAAGAEHRPVRDVPGSLARRPWSAAPGGRSGIRSAWMCFGSAAQMAARTRRTAFSQPPYRRARSAGAMSGSKRRWQRHVLASASSEG